MIDILIRGLISAAPKIGEFIDSAIGKLEESANQSRLQQNNASQFFKPKICIHCNSNLEGFEIYCPNCKTKLVQ